jgi:hypothetical protein
MDLKFCRNIYGISITDCVADRIRPGVPQATERQRVRDQIKAAMIFALTVGEIFSRLGSVKRI